MVLEKTVELICYGGCPNADLARANLRAALVAAGREVIWMHWDLFADWTPEHLRRHGSPTVLVDGRDVMDGDAGGAAMACRADGAPSVAAILEKLEGRADELEG